MSDTGDAQAVESEPTDDAGAVESETAVDGEATDEASEQEEPAVDAHLEDVDDGCGCAEVWEHLSEQREE
jgi:hypothetical protein